MRCSKAACEVSRCSPPSGATHACFGATKAVVVVVPGAVEVVVVCGAAVLVVVAGAVVAGSGGPVVVAVRGATLVTLLDVLGAVGRVVGPTGVPATTKVVVVVGSATEPV